MQGTDKSRGSHNIRAEQENLRRPVNERVGESATYSSQMVCLYEPSVARDDVARSCTSLLY